MVAKKKFLKLKEELSKHNNAYYNTSPLISDQEYDDLKSQYEIAALITSKLHKL